MNSLGSRTKPLSDVAAAQNCRDEYLQFIRRYSMTEQEIEGICIVEH
jgi:hypothetical protein